MSMKSRHNYVRFLEKKSIKNFLSVIIPVYKDVDGLEKTITSLHEQSLEKHKFEIIVVNDGGSKNIENLCKRFKVSCLSIKPRKGSYNARNIALMHSRGELLVFIDAGTIADNSWLKNGSNTLKKYDYVGGYIEVVRNPKDKISDSLFIYQKATSFDVKRYMTNLHFAPTTNLFVKRHVIEKIGGFDKRLQSGGDWEFGDRVAGSGFTQRYNRRVKVYHYARNYKFLLTKNKRVSAGQANLVKF